MFENQVADVEVDGRHVELVLWDTAGQETYDRLRPLTYADSHVILICFGVDFPDSLYNVHDKARTLLHNANPFCIDCCVLVDSRSKSFLWRSTYTPYWMQDRSQTRPAGGWRDETARSKAHYL